MYIPAHFAPGDPTEIAAFVDRAGAADLVTFDGTRPISTLLPVIWDRSCAPHGRLIGHIARSNPQWITAAAAKSIDARKSQPKNACTIVSRISLL